MNIKRGFWRWLLSAVLWIIIAGGGLSLVQPLMVIFFAIGTAIRSGEVTGVIMDKYRIVSVRHFGLVAYGVVWLAGVVGLGTYLGKSKTTGALLKRSGIIIGIEAAVWAIGWVLQEIMM